MAETENIPGMGAVAQWIRLVLEMLTSHFTVPVQVMPTLLLTNAPKNQKIMYQLTWSLSLALDFGLVQHSYYINCVVNRCIKDLSLSLLLSLPSSLSLFQINK